MKNRERMLMERSSHPGTSRPNRTPVKRWQRGIKKTYIVMGVASVMLLILATALQGLWEVVEGSVKSEVATKQVEHNATAAEYAQASFVAGYDPTTLVWFGVFSILLLMWVVVPLWRGKPDPMFNFKS